MNNPTIDEILSFVEKPSRYLGSETNTIKKDPKQVKLRFALGFPDLYEIGTSHFGLQILYHILNSHPDIAAERVFTPGIDMQARLRHAGLPLFSLESHTPLDQFDIIGFSLLYELNYTNVLAMLDLAVVPFLAVERDLSHPIVIGGGPCTCNPEPVADFFDAIVIGDGENVIMDMAAIWLQWKDGIRADKEDLLKEWSKIEGVYIPGFFTPQIDPCGFQTLEPRYSHYNCVSRGIVADLNQAPFPEKPIIPYGKPVHDRLRLEVSRGCSRGCRFCQAGMIYRPVRERSPDNLILLSDKSLKATGYEDISLLSLSTGDYGCIVSLMQRLMSGLASERVAVSLPSLRAGTLTPELMQLIKKVRKTGFTIAPEAGSQRLRDVINKNINEAEIFDTVKDAFDLGWQVIKLYFMIGLPTETEDDVKALVDLVKRLRKIEGPKKRKGKINVSVTTFIPKPHTPFQWASQIPMYESHEKLKWIQSQLNLPGLQFKWQNPQVSVIEGLWARGDRRLCGLLMAAYNQGCKFDGWSDQFQYSLWRKAFSETGVDPDFYISRKRDIFEPLPWDHIDIQISKTFLRDEWEKAQCGQYTADCRISDCNRCGVCDFEKIEPIVYQGVENLSALQVRKSDDTEKSCKKLKVKYSKKDQAKFFGHLELVNIFLRALHRAGIHVKFSEGYHPKPKVSFNDPLPIGLESENENFSIIVSERVRSHDVVQRLNSHLPEGLRVHDCELEVGALDRHRTPNQCTYKIVVKEPCFDPNKLNAFIQNADVIVEISNSKGKLKKINLKDMVLNIRLIDPRRLEMTLLCEPGKTLRPNVVLQHVFQLTEDQIKRARILKIDKN